MQKSVFVNLHWNTDYAEFPRSELPKVVETSYNEMLSALEDFEGTICCSITGHSLEYFSDQHPSIIDKLQNLIKSKTIELIGIPYSHPILPLIPIPRIRQQITDQKALVQKLFNSATLSGFWPPELAISPAILRIVKNLGFDWIIVDYELLLRSQSISNNFNPYEKQFLGSNAVLAKAYHSTNVLSMIKTYTKALRHLVRLNKSMTNSLETIQFTTDSSIKGVLSSNSWWNSTRFAISNTTRLYRESKHIKLIENSKNNFIPVYASDIEFFGYREFGGRLPQPSLLVNFLKKLQKLEIPTISPSSLDSKEWNQDPIFIGTGSWSDDESFRIWTDSEDNRQLNRELTQIYQYLSQQNWDSKLMEKIEPSLRIAENSDARGWSPLPERKLEAFSAIQKIYQILGV